MKKIVLTLTAAMLFVWQGLGFADSAVDSLIQKLEDKGILTDQDAQQLKTQVNNDQQTQQTTFKSMLPDWIDNIKITGDFRLRDQYQRISSPGGSVGAKAGYNRARIRIRLNFEDQINDKVKVIFGIASSGENGAGVGNPRSNNFTLGGNNYPSESGFNKPEVVLNKAYAVYTPASWATLEGGKMDNPIWEPIGGNSNLLWDPNITPEGGAVLLQKKINDYITPFATNAVFVLADGTPSVAAPSTAGTGTFKTDPYMYALQAGIKGNATEQLYYKTVFNYYTVNNPNRAVFGNRPSAISSTSTSPSFDTNSTNASATQYTYGFNVVGGTADIGINDPFGELLPSPIYIPQVGVVGGYYRNQSAPSGDNAAWEVGAYAGSSQLNGWGTWKLTEVYKVLERDSWLDILPDADDYNGATDTKGYRTELDVGLMKNTWLALTYYHVNVYKYISALSYGTSQAAESFSAGAPENMFQVDMNFKF